MKRKAPGTRRKPPQKAAPGDWVEISAELLAPAERAPGLPADTAAVPLVMRVRGWAQESAEVGAEVSVKTQAGRTLRGKLLAVNPGWPHGFGECVPELIETRRRLNELMRGNGAP